MFRSVHHSKGFSELGLFWELSLLKAHKGISQSSHINGYQLIFICLGTVNVIFGLNQTVSIAKCDLLGSEEVI